MACKFKVGDILSRISNPEGAEWIVLRILGYRHFPAYQMKLLEQDFYVYDHEIILIDELYTKVDYTLTELEKVIYGVQV